MANNATEGELLALEQLYWESIKNKDSDTAMRLSDNPCLVTGAQGVGVIERQQLGMMLRNASYTLNEFEIRDARVRVLGEDIAILAYKVHEELTVDGLPVTIDAADSSTWVRREGRWLCAMHTEALTGDPFGRDRRSRA